MDVGRACRPRREFEMPGRFGPVVVGIDGSADSRRAMLIAARHARSLGTDVVVVHAIGLTRPDDGSPTFGHRSDIAAQVDRWSQALRDEGWEEYDVVLEDGPPVDVLARVARDRDAAMIVVGRRGAGGRPELRLGSTAHQVVELARCPVLVVPPVGHVAAADAGDRRR